MPTYQFLGGEDTAAQEAELTSLLRTALHPLLQQKSYSSYSGLSNHNLNFQSLSPGLSKATAEHNFTKKLNEVLS